MDLAIAVMPVILASVAGQIATFPNIEGWYAALNKPWFNPPTWLFGPTWTALYILMALAAWRLLRLPRHTFGRGSALALFFAQLALNALWSGLFFALHNPLAGLVNIVLQLLLIALTIKRARHVDNVAAVCLIPLAVWVAFATILNFEMWRLNG
ncbi:TspO/MBR family protein [Rhizobium grahamii]|uniref:TspO/MBR family protein n=1 Tax=Rhizobium grahamii TaxID=1120045 RepID=UPI001FD58156|nr:TspO/MBR family protein [Rhizobium grahamii]